MSMNWAKLYALCVQWFLFIHCAVEWEKANTEFLSALGSGYPYTHFVILDVFACVLIDLRIAPEY